MEDRLSVVGYQLSAEKRQPKPTISLRLLEHDGRERMFAEFPFNRQLANLIREIPGARWSQRKKMWHVHPTNQVYLLLRRK